MSVLDGIDVFPDLALPDHTGRERTLSEIAAGDPLTLVFSRGWWCPKEQRYLRELVRLQDEFEVAYSKIVVVSVDAPEVQSALRAGLGARFVFLSDHERRYLNELGLRETTDTVHHPYQPAVFTPTLTCASTGPTTGTGSAGLPYDTPEVQGVRRHALAWWIPLLGDTLVCLTTLALDSAGYGGSVTVATDPSLFDQDPFARIFPGTIVRTELFCGVSPPPGPVIERYHGVAWPGGQFE